MSDEITLDLLVNNNQVEKVLDDISKKFYNLEGQLNRFITLESAGMKKLFSEMIAGIDELAVKAEKLGKNPFKGDTSMFGFMETKGTGAANRYLQEQKELDKINRKKKEINELDRKSTIHWNTASQLIEKLDINKLFQDTTSWNMVLKKSADLGRLTAQGFDTTKQQKEVQRLARLYDVSNKAIKRAFKEGEASASRFDARLLTLMFTGMAIQRTFGGMLRGIATGWMRAEDNTSNLGRATTRLSAAWEFLKFSMFDALNNDFFIGIIDGVVNLINWFNNLDSDVKIVIDSIIVSLGLLGTGAVVWSNIKSASNAMFGVGGLLTTGVGDSNTAITNLTKSKGFKTLQTMAGVGLSIKTILDLEDLMINKDKPSQWLKKLSTDLGLLGFVLTGKTWYLSLIFVPELLKAGKSITNFGKDLMGKSIKLGSEGVGDILGGLFGGKSLTAGETVMSILKVGVGVLGSFAGSVTTGAGVVLDFGQNMLDSADAVNTDTVAVSKNNEELKTNLDLRKKIQNTNSNIPAFAKKYFKEKNIDISQVSSISGGT